RGRRWGPRRRRPAPTRAGENSAGRSPSPRGDPRAACGGWRSSRAGFLAARLGGGDAEVERGEGFHRVALPAQQAVPPPPRDQLRRRDGGGAGIQNGTVAEGRLRQRRDGSQVAGEVDRAGLLLQDAGEFL